MHEKDPGCRFKLFLVKLNVKILTLSDSKIAFKRVSSTPRRFESTADLGTYVEKHGLCIGLGRKIFQMLASGNLPWHAA